MSENIQEVEPQDDNTIQQIQNSINDARDSIKHSLKLLLDVKSPVNEEIYNSALGNIQDIFRQVNFLNGMLRNIEKTQEQIYEELTKQKDYELQARRPLVGRLG